MDKLVTGMAFDIHNEFGRFCDENIYQAELMERCISAGIEGHSEVEIRVSYDTFHKSYFIDLLLSNSIVYELKTAKTLNGEHRKQILNYLLLANLAHGALINFRPASVAHEFASTRLTMEQRLDYTLVDDGWKKLDGDSEKLRTIMSNLLQDWGAFLDSNLYTEAITHFLGGEEQVVQAIPVSKGNRVLGKQNVHLLNPATAFIVSATTKNPGYYQNHIQRFLDHTDIKAIQWINLNHAKIEFRTLT
ncbi:GxxExxY protein [Pontiella desulfatans]|uniref:GxxExxY protein n=1 Tax=Pontiella desulfatans TaxID=2750659 RepID=UPI0014442748|nr:GxxExxY protein [Pontiella desulfatans]